MTSASAQKDRDEAFIGFLQSLASSDNRAALATLRRGLSSSATATVGMYRYVAGWVGPKEMGWDEECLYLIAALFGMYPDASAAETNFGGTVRELSDLHNPASVERRFTSMLAADPGPLQAHLRHAIALCSSKRIGIDWLRLLRDIRHWRNPQRSVQRAWAREFWRKITPKPEPEEKEQGPGPLIEVQS
jgi:CRISPR type I-E-associated protein CasB/Cse2